MKKTILLAFFICSFLLVRAQQSSVFSQAAESFGLHNPAGLALEEMKYHGTMVNAHVRNQWWDPRIPGQPKNQTLTWVQNQPDQLYGARLGADQTGETSRIGVSGRYAHAVGDGLKIGVGAGLFSTQTFVEKLDIYDLDDPVAFEAGESRLELEATAGAFYHFFHPNNAWQWFAGASFRRVFYLSPLTGSEDASAENALHFQGGASHGKLTLSGQVRISFEQPSAFDLYLRRYFLEDTFFLGLMVTSDLSQSTAGGQAGYEWLIKAGGSAYNHYLTFSFAMSKPLSRYIDGSNLIVDFRVVWIWAHGRE